jgi:cytochrome c oxidase subunit IV
MSDVSLPESLPASDGPGHEHQHDVEKVSTYLTVFAALMVLLVVTYIAAKIDLDHLAGGLNLIVAMSIAVVKALMVVLIFMHVKQGSRLLWVFVGASFMWLAIMFIMFFSDYSTRGWQPGMQASINEDSLTRSAVVERHMSEDAINVSPPHN